MVDGNSPDKLLQWPDPMLLMGTTLFCSALCKLRRDQFPCQVCAVLCDSQGWWTVADAAVAESLPWLCTLPWGEVGCEQPTPAEHFLVGLFPPAVRKQEQIQKSGGMYQAGIWTMSLCCHRLATDLQRQPGAGTQPHTQSIARSQYCWREMQKATRLCWRLSRASQNEMLGTGPCELLPLSWGWTPTKGLLPGTGCQHFISQWFWNTGLEKLFWADGLWTLVFGFAVLDLSSPLFPLFWRGCKKIFFFTPFSTGTKHWISYSLQLFPRKGPSCLRLVTAPALGLDFTCSETCERAITGIVKTVGRQSVFTELSWKMHG